MTKRRAFPSHLRVLNLTRGALDRGGWLGFPAPTVFPIGVGEFQDGEEMSMSDLIRSPCDHGL